MTETYVDGTEEKSHKDKGEEGAAGEHQGVGLAPDDVAGVAGRVRGGGGGDNY